MPNAIAPPTVLLLCESEALGNLDKRALRDAGAVVGDVVFSGVEAARLLAGRAVLPDVVVCPQRLGDMDGVQFCSLMRLHPRLRPLPVLLLLAGEGELQALQTLGSDASALLARPYSLEAFRDCLWRLAEKARRECVGTADTADTQAFAKALASGGILLKAVHTPEDYCRVGMECLNQGKWNQAVEAFARAKRDGAVRGKAALGLAAAWQGKGDVERHRQAMGEAAAIFVKEANWERARAVYARLLRDEPNARSPFLAAALPHVRQGQFAAAAAILAKGIGVTPHQQACEKISQACMAAAQPGAAAEGMRDALENALGASGSVLGGEIVRLVAVLVQQAAARRQEGAAERQRAVRETVRRRETAPSVPAPANLPDDADTGMPVPGEGGTADGTSEAATRTARAHPRPGEPAMPLLPSAPSGKGDAGAGDVLSVLRLTWRLARRK